MKKNWPNNLIATPARQQWVAVVAGVLLNIILWVLIYATFPHSAPATVLHYSVGIGVDFIGEGKQIIVLPAAGSILLILNALGAYLLRRASQAAAWILLGSGILLQVLLLVAYIYILRLNL